MNDREYCPRCNGVVLADPFEDDVKCVTCGWHPRTVPDDVMLEVEAHKGKSNIGHNRKRPPQGKPALSGWERLKRRREKQRQLDNQALE
jgi:Zn ribbon nucleic-acid-binding protein